MRRRTSARTILPETLVAIFEDSTYGLRDMELGTLLRLLIVADVIGQSVVQMTYAHVLVNR